MQTVIHIYFEKQSTVPFGLASVLGIALQDVTYGEGDAPFFVLDDGLVVDEVGLEDP